MANAAVRESTIDSFIDDYKEQEIRYDSNFLKENVMLSKFAEESNIPDAIILEDSVLDKYRKDLDELLMVKEFTSAEKSKYLYNPWTLSYDLYGSVEYWALLLEANNMFSILEFNQTKIKVYNKTLPSFISSILELEDKLLTVNRTEVNENDIKYSSEDN